MMELKEKLVERLEWLSSYGKDPNGGISRLLYTPEWLQAQNSLKAWMEEENLVANFDEIGNLFGTLQGENEEEIILTGSHVDTVVQGGHLDGQLGIVAGVIALSYLSKTYGKPKRTIEVVSMAEEEGSRFPFAFWGSKNIVGMSKIENVSSIKDFNGISFSQAMSDCGFTYREDNKGLRKGLKAFVELHIEQGNVLEKEEKSVGVVHSIVGQRRFTVHLKGEANHAGTTPMGYRRDSLFAASEMVVEMMNLARKYGDPLVATVGKLEVTPNIVNVVPGNTMFTIDVRHTSQEILVEFTTRMQEVLKEIAQKHDVEFAIDMWMDAKPIPMNEQLVEIVQSNCEELNLNYKLMHSGAGHDAQIFAPYVPTVMIFTPSYKGISHNPEEFTEPADLFNGLKVLIQTLYDLAYK